eukprot:6843370-Pyramimonas_sp.AAC.1
MFRAACPAEQPERCWRWWSLHEGCRVPSRAARPTTAATQATTTKRTRRAGDPHRSTDPGKGPPC